MKMGYLSTAQRATTKSGENEIFTRRRHKANHGDFESAKCVREIASRTVGLSFTGMLHDAEGNSLNSCKFIFMVKQSSPVSEIGNYFLSSLKKQSNSCIVALKMEFNTSFGGNVFKIHYLICCHM